MVREFMLLHKGDYTYNKGNKTFIKVGNSGLQDVEYCLGLTGEVYIPYLDKMYLPLDKDAFSSVEAMYMELNYIWYYNWYLNEWED